MLHMDTLACSGGSSSPGSCTDCMVGGLHAVTCLQLLVTHCNDVLNGNSDLDQQAAWLLAGSSPKNIGWLSSHLHIWLISKYT